MKKPEIIIIIDKIEELRLKLNELADKKGTIDQEVLNASQKLDGILNQYYFILKQIRC